MHDQQRREVAHHFGKAAVKNWASAINAEAFTPQQRKKALTLLRQLEMYTRKVKPRERIVDER